MNPSIQCPETPDDNPAFFLNLFITDEILSTLKLWSNGVWQAYDEGEDVNLEKERFIIETDLKKFFAIIFAMALNTKLTLQSYRSTDPIFHQEFFSLPNLYHGPVFHSFSNTCTSLIIRTSEKNTCAKLHPS